MHSYFWYAELQEKGNSNLIHRCCDGCSMTDKVGVEAYLDIRQRIEEELKAKGHQVVIVKSMNKMGG